MALPNKYTQLNALYANGSQYLKTDIVPNHNTRVVMEVVDANVGAYFFGAWSTDFNKGAYAIGNDNGNTYVGYGNTGGNSGIPVRTGNFTIDFNNNGKIYYDNEEVYTLTQSTFSAGYPLYLFAQNRKGTVGYSVGNRDFGVKYCKIYNEGNLIRSYIPCRRKQDGKLGFYEEMMDKFILSSDGEFVLPMFYYKVEGDTLYYSPYDSVGYKHSVVNDALMFGRCEGFNNVKIIKPKSKTQDLITMTSMRDSFYGCSNLEKVDLSRIYFITDADVRSRNNTFYNCTNLVEVVLPVFSNGTGNYNASYSTFKKAGKLGNTLKVSGLIGSENGNNILTYFLSSTNYSKFDLTELRFSKNASYSFEYFLINNYNLTTIYCNEDWYKYYKGLGQPNSLFNKCNNLIGGAGSSYSTYGSNLSYAKVDGGQESPGYFTEKNVYDIKVRSNPPEGGTLTLTQTGDNSFLIEATPNKDYVLLGWNIYVGGEFVKYEKNILNNKLPLISPVKQTEIIVEGVFTSSKNPYKPEVSPEDLPSDTITDDKPTGWMEYSDNPMTEIFVPTSEELASIATQLYGQDFSSLVNNVLDIKISDVIHSLMVLPVVVPTDGTKRFRVGWAYSTSGKDIHYTNKNYVELDCGSLVVPSVYNGYLDYQTNIQLYLPFIGYVNLENYDVIGKTLNIKYQIDLASGDCIAKVFVNDSIKYQFLGTCGYTLPINELDPTKTVIKPVMNIAGALVGTAVGLGGDMVTATSALKLTNISRSRKSGAITSIRQAADKVTTTTTPSRDVKELIGDFSNLGTGVSRGSGLSANGGYLSVNTPYLIISWPNWDVPANFAHLNGFPCNKFLKLGNLSGFTIVDDIHLNNIPCTSIELDEIESLLKEGVIL